MKIVILTGSYNLHGTSNTLVDCRERLWNSRNDAKSFLQRSIRIRKKD